MYDTKLISLQAVELVTDTKRRSFEVTDVIHTI